MQTRRLGHSPLHVTELSFGTWLTVAGGIVRDQAIRCIHAALDCGIRLFDTANQYGAGEAERVLGTALANYPRDRYLIATKLFFPVGNEPDHGLSAAQISKQLDRSLERLGTDYIDLYQCHRYDRETPLEETMEALNCAVISGKVRAIGFSEWCGASPRRRSFPRPRVTALAPLPSRRWLTASSPASTRRDSRLPREAAPPATK